MTRDVENVSIGWGFSIQNQITMVLGTGGASVKVSVATEKLPVVPPMPMAPAGAPPPAR